jgi:asparagine synthase (glutamine-hydrolysing)
MNIELRSNFFVYSNINKSGTTCNKDFLFGNYNIDIEKDFPQFYVTSTVERFEYKHYQFIYYAKNSYNIYHLIEKYKEIGLPQLEELSKSIVYNTDFLLIVYDKVREKIFAVRSANGTIPLYFYNKNGLFMMSMHVHSIAKSLHEYFFSEIGLSFLFSSNYIMEPYTLYEDIYEIERDFIYEFNLRSSEINTRKYYDFKYSLNKEEGLEYYIHNLKENILLAHEKRIGPSNGIFLSGGIDSIVMCHALKSVSTENIQSFNVSVEGQKRSEAPYAKAAADYFGLEHHEIVISPSNKQYESIFHKIISSNFPYWGVLYIGQILEELGLNDYHLFTGQDTRLHTPYLNSIDRLVFSLNKPNISLKKINSVTSSIALKAAKYVSGKPRKIINRLIYTNCLSDYVIKFLYHVDLENDIAKDLMTTKIDNIINNIGTNKSFTYQEFFNQLTWVKWGFQYTDDIKYMDSLCNMHHSVCQFPFYDLLLAEFSASVPFKYSNKHYVGRSSFNNRFNINKKYVLKKYLEMEGIPDKITSRNKAVSTTIHDFFNTSFGGLVKERLSTTKIVQDKTIRILELENLVTGYLNEDKTYTLADFDYLSKIYNLFVLDTLVRFLDGEII